MTWDLLIPVHTTSDASNRITLPKYLSDCLPWVTGTDTIEAWVLQIELGRYRLLSDEQVQGDSRLEPIRSLLLEKKTASPTEPTFAEEIGRAAMVARLLPTAITPPKPGWRIAFPRAFDPFAPEGCDRNAFSVLLSPEGYLEIWYTDILRKASLLPLRK
jgi:hypothetical protein